jgi:hypothetical protein
MSAKGRKPLASGRGGEVAPAPGACAWLFALGGTVAAGAVAADAVGAAGLVGVVVAQPPSKAAVTAAAIRRNTNIGTIPLVEHSGAYLPRTRRAVKAAGYRITRLKFKPRAT